MRISAAASGTFRQRTNAFVRRADSSKSAGSRVRTYSHCPSCRDNAAIRPDYRNAPKASILILTLMTPTPPHLVWGCGGVGVWDIGQPLTVAMDRWDYFFSSLRLRALPW